jgi:hypothetical protein
MAGFYRFCKSIWGALELLVGASLRRRNGAWLLSMDVV